MRLINQFGTVDIPYELCALSIGGMSGKATIYIRSKALDERPIAFADYSSEEKAMKVLEMVRNAYAGVILFQNVEVTEEAMEILKKSNLQGIISTTDEKSNVEYIGNTVFRFPKDSEVEV